MILLTIDTCIQDCLNCLRQCQTFTDDWESGDLATAIAFEKYDNFLTFNQNRAEVRRRCLERCHRQL